MAKIINLSPHDLNIFVDGKLRETIPSSGSARCTQSNKIVGSVNDIPTAVSSFGEVTGLPEPVEETFYYVSLIVRNALPIRNDLLSPCDLVRDEKGVILGVSSFSVNN
jgi:hypothetical protein